MPAAVVLRFSNTSPDDVLVVLEPWATEVVLGAGSAVEVVSSGTEGVMEVEHADGRVLLYGWPGAVLHLATNGTQLSSGAIVRRDGAGAG